MNGRLLLQQVLNGLAIGSVYAIFALGYTLIFSVLRIINFTHGAIFTLGAYAAYALTGSSLGINGLLAGLTLPFRLPFVLALLGGSLVAAACGVIVERLSFRPLRVRGADPLLSLVSSLGVAVALVMALEPELLLLDEPAAGMNPGEKRALSDLIRNVRAQLGLTILLIEHHVPLVMDL